MSERLGPETKAIIQAIRDTENTAEKYQTGVWTLERVGKTNIFKAYITEDPNAIAMTGVNVVTQLQIPFAHRIIAFLFRHTTALFVDSYDNLDFILRRIATTMFPVQMRETLFYEMNITDEDGEEIFGENFEREACAYTITLNSTATNLIFLLFYIQKLGA
jgi:hypothetical protein